MKKFTFIGAGSLDFTKDLVRDILTFEAFRDAELMLMDIDPKRLEYAVKGVQKIVDAGKYPAVVKGTQDRKEADVYKRQTQGQDNNKQTRSKET